MKTYARMVDGCAVDVTTADPNEIYHPDVAATFDVVPDGTANGDKKTGTTWAKYVAPVAVVVPPKPPTVTPPQFKLLIFAELPEILAKVPTDPTIAAFVSIIDDPRLTEVDLSLESTINGLTYCFTAIGRTAAQIATRLAEVKTGVWK